jgi:hypothetical protein
MNMFWTIVRREFLDHVMNLRFFAIFVLTLILMAISVVVFTVNYEKAMKEQPHWVSNLVGDDGKTDLRMTPCAEGTLRQFPSALAFCSGTSENELPQRPKSFEHNGQYPERIENA